jgi:hypothetical protein
VCVVFCSDHDSLQQATLRTVTSAGLRTMHGRRRHSMTRSNDKAVFHRGADVTNKSLMNPKVDPAPLMPLLDNRGCNTISKVNRASFTTIVHVRPNVEPDEGGLQPRMKDRVWYFNGNVAVRDHHCVHRANKEIRSRNKWVLDDCIVQRSRGRS